MYFPDIATLVATTTGPIGILIVWALPVIGVLIAFAVAGTIARKVRTTIPRFASKALGGGRRGRGRRR